MDNIGNMIAPAQPQQGGPSRENDPPPAEPSTQTKKAEKGKKPKKPALPVFHKLEAGFQWWVEDGESVSSRNARIKNQVAIGPGKVLLPAERVALGLNELCCERGLGKVRRSMKWAIPVPGTDGRRGNRSMSFCPTQATYCTADWRAPTPLRPSQSSCTSQKTGTTKTGGAGKT